MTGNKSFSSLKNLKKIFFFIWEEVQATVTYFFTTHKIVPRNLLSL